MANSIPTTSAKLQLRVEVIGADLFGMQFFEPAQTLTVYRSGLTVLLENDLAPDSEVVVRNQENNKEAVVRVLGQIRKEKTGHVYGLAFLDPAADPWHLQIPDTGEERTVQLECSGCRHHSSFSLSEIDSEVLAATRALSRPCKDCNSYKKWREPRPQTAEKRSGRARAGASKPELASGQGPASSPKERRRERRAAMKVVACIRFAGQEVEVACDDISKGGFRFTCTREFPEGTRLETAVPYTKFSTNIFSPASIVFCQQLPDGRYQHGVAHFKPGGPIGWEP